MTAPEEEAPPAPAAGEADAATEPDGGPPADRWQASDQAAGKRLDAYLAQVYRQPRNQVARWLEAGRVTVDGAVAKASRKLAGGEALACRPLERAGEGALAPESGPLDLLFVDDQLIVADKPANLVVHPGAGGESGTLAHRLLDRFPEIERVGGPGRPGVVHRLDRGTSGVIVFARTDRAYAALTEAFAARRVEKRYLAIAYGAPAIAAGTVEAPIGRHRERRKEMAVRDDGKPAATGYRALAMAGGLTFFELCPVTGRTHQIRVHLKHLGHPIVGDDLYAGRRWKDLPRDRQAAARNFGRPALHAWRLGLPHPATGEPVELESPLPKELAELWRRLTGAKVPKLAGRGKGTA